MRYLKGKEIRKLFLDYFAKQGHEIVPSSPLVPADDPTLLFTNAGMVQFKKVFLGQEERPYKRAASCQKCVRAGGKHNDLENVGYTARHHTFFEMLGNFSFGDYFKEEAIFYAWEFLTKVLELPKERLYVTVYKDDDEAYALWQKIAGLSQDRIVRLGEKDNFWAMGDTGPCGPCSEIIFDQGEDVGCGRPDCQVGCDCDRYLELWNLVFMQYERDEKGNLSPLPRPCIDTGMGLERITATIQGVKTNFDCDLFAGLMSKISDLTGIHYGENKKTDVAFRVIADHSRAAAFLIADGVLPSNEGRGYVLRRIIRRAIRFGRTLGLEKPFLYDTALVVVEEMGDVYPELLRAAQTIEKILVLEEERFRETLERGLSLLYEEIEKLKKSGEKIIPGSFIFKLYDTYGFPYDIVRDIALEHGLELDMLGFEKEMAKQRERSRKAWKGELAKAPQVFTKLLEKGLGKEFVGYETTEAEAEILAIVQKGKEIDALCEGEEAEAVFSKTPFYGEAGGQVGDTGLVIGKEGQAEVVDTYRLGEIFVHKLKCKTGTLKKGEKVKLSVFSSRRAAIARHHTATHLLHAALRRILGDHVHQAGSLVAPDRLRFDFTHFEPLKLEEIFALEDLINARIRDNIPVEVKLMSYKEAIDQGAMALFGEKYADKVRVIRIGNFSMELCGGTHVHRTGDIGFFKIIAEGSVSAGVRRIEAVAGEPAVNFVHDLEKEKALIASKLKVAPSELPKRVETLLKQLKEAQEEIETLRRQLARGGLESLLNQVQEINGIKIIAAEVPAKDAKTLREMGDFLREKLGSGVVVLGASVNGKAQLLAMVTKDLKEKVHAGKIISALAPLVGGRGGGRPDMAQGGGPDAQKLKEALEKAPKLIADMIK
ncbi:alanine--tRNA ligase [Thermodesulfatator atlanticus]|uniref:alanine--tRNA ligase n=1 Tax=Thermodesulfatator atlanticus TaxID=501497 RepID=UPI0003B6F48C|nr:alanine--tRNA ligase [Thermodesulfatator atlanticus]